MRKFIVGAGLLLVVGLGLFYFRPDDVSPDAVTLKPDEVQKVTITPHQIVNTRKDKLTGEIKVDRKPNYGHGVVTVIKKDGTVTVKAKEFGFFENDFGLSTDFRRIGVATELMYWRRLSWLGGSHFINLKSGKPELHLFTAVGYRLPISKMNNVSLYTGIDTERKVIFGAYLRFGNS